MAQVTNEWVKGDLIDSGSFGCVHLAMNASNGRLFVVKSSQSPTGFASLDNEANILMNLDSPYVVQYLGKEVTHGFNDAESVYNIFMEHMAGGSLFDLIDRFQGPLFEGAIRGYTRQILMGLNHLHERGIVHCDIKCKNILLDSFGNIKLADFGCSRALNELIGSPKKSSGSLQCKQLIMGTPLWMAPELLKDGELDFAADIWSLGCTVIEMATGKPPVWGTTVEDPLTLVFKIALSNETPRFPTRFSDQGLDFIARCLERDPSKRWTAKELLNHPFISEEKHTQVEMTMKTGAVLSPLSVLDVKGFDVWSSDGEDEINGCFVDEVESVSRSSMVSEKHGGCKERLESISCVGMNTIFEESGDWVAVRSI